MLLEFRKAVCAFGPLSYVTHAQVKPYRVLTELFTQHFGE